VRALEERDRGAYETFVRSHPAGLLYYGLAYRDLLVEQLGCEHRYLVAVEDGELRGVLPVMWREREGTRVYNSLPYFGSHGWVLGDEPAERALASAWQSLAEAETTASATAVSNPVSEPACVPPHTMVTERISQMMPLPDLGTDHADHADEAVLDMIDSSARRNVRKALRAGFSLETGAEGVEARLEALWRIHRDNMRQIGAGEKSCEFFAAIPRHFRPVEDFEVYLAHLDGQQAAALLVFYYGDTAEYFTPAVEHSHRSDQPLAGILLRAVADAARRGLRRWNWGGTGLSQEGVYRFKRKWGARERRYRYFIQLNDDSILDRSAEDLAEDFDHFFVVPYSQLRSKGGAPSDARS
jgi:Acetyltransferase (GNAT) domain